jgi:hypothetical protein
MDAGILENVIDGYIRRNSGKSDQSAFESENKTKFRCSIKLMILNFCKIRLTEIRPYMIPTNQLTN